MGRALDLAVPVPDESPRARRFADPYFIETVPRARGDQTDPPKREEEQR